MGSRDGSVAAGVRLPSAGTGAARVLDGEDPIGWYGEQFIFHLERDGTRNERWLFCTREQRAAIAAMLEHIIETRAELLETYMSDHQAFRVLEIWRDLGD
jgi:hypothetical protein